MRLTLALALLALPATAFAQENLMPMGPIPVHKCVQTASGETCSPVQDGTGFSAANGYTRVYRQDATPSQQAMTTQREMAEPNLTR